MFYDTEKGEEEEVEEEDDEDDDDSENSESNISNHVQVFRNYGLQVNNRVNKFYMVYLNFIKNILIIVF